jgi:hypothetical protein
VLTPHGAQQVFQVGSDYRARYLSSSSPHRIRNMSEFEYVPAQIHANAPDEPILLSTATSFLQALYPPLGDSPLAAQDLANGSSVSAPLTGYQYVTLHGVNDDSPETVWIKGDDQCPAFTTASSSFATSTEYASRLASTRDFYASLHPLVADVYPSPEDLDYAHAYDIFDLVNVAHLHNAAAASPAVTQEQLFQLRTLADSAEFGRNFNASQPERSIHAAAFAGGVLRRLEETVSSSLKGEANPKFTLLAGSYDTFLAFFGLADLTSVSGDFYGLPAYASSMAFELFTPGEEGEEELDEAALRVRYLFRNGTEGELTPFPLFGSAEADLPWAEFVHAMRERGIDSTAEWCGACRSDAVFCAAYGNGVEVASTGGQMVSRESWIAALVVMAVAIAGNLIWAAMWLVKSRRAKKDWTAAAAVAAKTAESVRSYDGKESV